MWATQVRPARFARQHNILAVIMLPASATARCALTLLHMFLAPLPHVPPAPRISRTLAFSGPSPELLNLLFTSSLSCPPVPMPTFSWNRLNLLVKSAIFSSGGRMVVRKWYVPSSWPKPEPAAGVRRSAGVAYIIRGTPRLKRAKRHTASVAYARGEQPLSTLLLPLHPCTAMATFPYSASQPSTVAAPTQLWGP